ncbi:hypothetical protein [Palleronia sp.]|uniref:hypothetical protein n=1 Tax=Palleronia sp. TaxID=1940284 RepID=UPI0035C810C0
MRMVFILGVALSLSACVPAQPPLEERVAVGARHYGVDVAPEDLTFDQTAAMSLTLDQARKMGYLDTRRRLRAILRNPDFAD